MGCKVNRGWVAGAKGFLDRSGTGRGQRGCTQARNEGVIAKGDREGGGQVGSRKGGIQEGSENGR